MRHHLCSSSIAITLLAVLVLSGCKGNTGDVGVQGLTGQTGDMGEVGSPGPAGSIGLTGQAGPSAATVQSVFDQVEVILANTTTKPIGQITLTVPGPGFVLVQVVFDVGMSKPLGVDVARAFFSLHTDGTTEIQNRHEVGILRVSNEPTSPPLSIIMPVSLQRIFSVTEGQHTFYLRGARNDSFGNNTVQVFGKTLSAIYIPM